MKVFYSLEHIEKKSNTVLTIGTFDGIHKGHQQILKEVTEKAKEFNCRSFVVTFHPHPRFVVSPEFNFKLLTTIDEKLNIFESLGIENVLVIEFTKEFSQTSYSDFIEKMICQKVGVKHIVIGYDHRFGKNRDGNIENLMNLSSRCNFSVSQVSEINQNQKTISSTLIRNYIKNGKIDEANLLLGRNYTFWGKVVRGSQRGRELGYPTANIQPDEKKVIPQSGVFGVKVTIKENEYFGVMNIGTRPTFENLSQSIIEIFIFDFKENIYSKNIKTEVLFYIRDERKFANKEELINQIEFDINYAKNIFYN